MRFLSAKGGALIGLVGLVALAASASPVAGAVSLFHITDLGDLGGGSSRAWDINSAGEIVGESTNATHLSRDFLYRNGAMGGITDYPFNGFAAAYGINNSQLIAGVDSGYAYRYDHGAKSAYPPFEGGSSGFQGIAYDLNNALPRPVYVGYAILTGASNHHAFAYDESMHQTTDLGTFGGSNSEAKGINDFGQIVGDADVIGDLHHHGFLFAGGTLSDIGTLGGSDSTVNRINNGGFFVGASTLAGDTITHAFISAAGKAKSDLGTLGGNFSEGLDINASAAVVGHSFTAGGAEHAFFISGIGGAMLDLNTLLDASGANWTLTTAAGINDSGRIVGTGVNPAGKTHAFLLTPVPEPGAGAALLFGVCSLVGGRPRRKV
jgi:probable HAF family extracellular repeat protein